MSKKTILLFPILFFICSKFSFSQTVINHWETVIYANDTWRYFVGVAQPTSNWRNIDFNDSFWQQGKGGFGYADGDESTIIPATISVYIRKTFTIIDTGAISMAILHVDYDDAFVAYLNGTEIGRANIGTVGISPAYNDTATTYREATMYQGGLPDSFVIHKPLLKTLLKNGENVLSFQFHNINAVSSDFSAIPFFSVAINNASTYYNPTPSWFFAPTFSNDFTSKLPIIVINTNGQAILDEPKIMADMGIISNGNGNLNHFNDAFNNYNGKIGIEIRGSSSQMFPKKSYGFETWNNVGNDIDASLLGMPEESDWILYAPFADKTLLRNELTYMIGSQTGHYTTRKQFCEVFLNNEYIGVYMLLEKIKRDKNRVNISKMEGIDTTGDALTGGYILKIDKVTGSGGEGWYSTFLPYVNPTFPVMFQYEYPKPEDIVFKQRSYIQGFMYSFESALHGSDFTNPETGYRKFIDVNSFVDYFIISELTKNVDAYRISTFMYKTRDSQGGKLFAGPIWDYDLGYGNCDFALSYENTGWQYILDGGTWQVPFWWQRLLEDSYFRNKLKCRWLELRQGVLSTSNLTHYIDSASVALQEARERNFEKWQIIGIDVWPNYFVGETYNQDLNYMKNWLLSRIYWLDNSMPGTCTSDIQSQNADNQFTTSVFPNPSNGNFSVKMENTKNQTFTIEILDISGRIVFQKNENFKNANIENFDCSLLARGMYWIHIKGADFREIKKIIIN